MNAYDAKALERYRRAQEEGTQQNERVQEELEKHNKRMRKREDAKDDYELGFLTIAKNARNIWLCLDEIATASQNNEWCTALLTHLLLRCEKNDDKYFVYGNLIRYLQEYENNEDTYGLRKFSLSLWNKLDPCGQNGRVGVFAAIENGKQAAYATRQNPNPWIRLEFRLHAFVLLECSRQSMELRETKEKLDKKTKKCKDTKKALQDKMLENTNLCMEKEYLLDRLKARKAHLEDERHETKGILSELHHKMEELHHETEENIRLKFENTRLRNENIRLEYENREVHGESWTSPEHAIEKIDTPRSDTTSSDLQCILGQLQHANKRLPTTFSFHAR